MCSMCMSSPCHYRCPNAPEPEPIYTCEKCGEGIFDGEKFYDCSEGCICERCLEDMPAKEVLAMCGGNLRTA